MHYNKHMLSMYTFVLGAGVYTAVMALSAAEKQRRYRQRRDADPESESRILGWLWRLMVKRSMWTVWMRWARDLLTLSSGPKHTKISVGMTMTKFWPSSHSLFVLAMQQTSFQLMRQYGERWWESWRLEAYDFLQGYCQLDEVLVSNAPQDIVHFSTTKPFLLLPCILSRNAAWRVQVHILL